ncbi:MAG: PEP-CTERM sorting domain-containing protein [Planctomycetota bacterium]
MTLKTLTFAFSAVLLAATVGQAQTVNSIIGNFDIAFDGLTGELTDFNRPAGGPLATADSRTVSSIEIEVGGVTQAMLMNPPDALFSDLQIGNLGSELTSGSLVMDAPVTGFGYDFFDLAGNLLRVDFNEISYTLVETGLPGLNFFNWFAEGTVVDQSLPNGIAYQPDVLVSFTATDVMVLPGTNGIRSLIASGAMTITGELVPEPTSAAMLALAGIGGCFRRRR